MLSIFTHRSRAGRALAALCLIGASGLAQAANIDLQVPSYTWTPDPVVNGGTVTFTITAQNNGPATSGAGTLTVALPSNVVYDAGSAKIDGVPGCVYAAATLTCSITPLALGQTATVTYTAKGNGSGVQNTTATLVETAPTNTDTNASNDSLTKSVTSIKGANLEVTQTGSNPPGCTAGCTAAAGSNYTFHVGVKNNNGPDDATTFQVTYNLPAAVDFTFASATPLGAGWTCPAPAGTTLTCTYSGAPIPANGSAPGIDITGQIITTAGSITGGVTVASTDSATGDPDLTAASNGVITRVVTVTPGTNLQANKTMVSNATGLTTVVNGEAVTLTLSATNTGTQQATGVTVTDTVPADFAIGALPGGCVAAGSTITCTVGTLNAGATSASFAIPLTVTGLAGASGTNTANVARVAPASGTNTPAAVAYSIVAPFSKLTITKSKVPLAAASPSGGTDPVQTGQKILNTVVVTNSSSSTSAATGTVTVVETLNDFPNETFDAVSSPGWSCTAGIPAANQVSCTYTIPVSLARGASLPALVFTTNALGSGMNLSNEVCTGGLISAHVPADIDAVADCSGVKTIYSTPGDVDIGITKATSDANISTAENTFDYTIVVTNHGAVTAPTVVVTDDIPMYQNIGGGVTATGVTPVLAGMGAGESCTVNATTGDVTCTIKNLAAAASRTITITVTRPFKDGAAFTNTASWDSPDIVQTVNVFPDSATATVQVDALADVTVTNIADAPHPARVGTELAYTTSIKNIGASTAANVVLYHTIDTAKMSYVAGSAALTTGGSCTFVTGFAAGPYIGQNGIQCDTFSLTSGESRQLTFKVIPNFSFYSGTIPPDQAYTSNAAITTTTTESNLGNNALSNNALVTNEQIDLAVTKQEAMGYDPDGAGPATNLLYDPVAFGDQIKYLVTFRNNGPSLATQVVATDTLTPPPGWTANFVSVSVDASSTYTPVSGVSCSVTGGATPGTNASPQVLTCYLGPAMAHADNILPSGKTVTLLMTFQTGGIDPPGSITFSNHATVRSSETGAAPYAKDTLAGNNEVTETTTVLPKTDLYVLKAASAGVDGNGSPYNINETFNYVLTVGNIGPSSAPGVRVTDALPAGLVATGNATVVAGAGVSLNSNTCHGVPWGGSCDLGPIPADATGTDATKQVVITIPVRAVYPYAGALLSNLTNTASVAPIGGASIDPVAPNNSSSVDIQIQASSIAGSVYGDDNRNDVFDAGEHINGATITLTGTDIYGNTFGIGGSPTFAALTTTTAGTGAFLFSKLPPGNWTLVETQPAGTFDRFETAGTAGGTIPAATCDGVANCSSVAAHNTISAITLPTATAATGYIFQEYRQAAVNGYVYYDANNNGLRSGAAETGIAGINVKLTGTSYAGQAISLTAATNATGLYSFTGVAPSENVTGYTVEEQTQPAGYLDAQEQNGAGVVVAATANRAAPESFVIGVLNPNTTLTERNFGELLPATVSGYVFLDADTDAVRDAGELAGITGLTITLTGTDDLGAVGPITATTGAGGAYSITNLRPGTYTVTETPPAGLTHTGAQAGSKGASGQAASTALPGVGVVSLTSITVAAGESATDNNFGESGQGISGFVYADLNNNGVKDAGEPGIPGIAVTLSGTASNGVDVCLVINPNPCTLTTDATGAYLFSGLPASNGAGYTLTEQSQASAPLSNYADGTDAKGTGIAVGGTTGNDVISGIGLVVGELGVNYNFGEIAASLAGRVYYDADNNGSFNGSESGLGGVTVTLSGTTASGANVCTVIAALYPTCAVTTAADGTYSFVGLPASNGAGYTLSESQPADYADRTTTPGNVGGVATGTTVSGITLGAGVAGTGYLFGEKTGAISGTVYADSNNNGTQDAGEPGISGVVLALSGTTASGANLCTATALHPNPCNATTDVNGNYSFSGLRNANGAGYTVTETQPASYVDGLDSKGKINAVVCAACSTAVNDKISGIPFDAANTHTVFNFGELVVASISGRVYHDVNNSSSYDAGEEMANVTVTLTGTDDLGAAVNTTTTTAANGTYSFANLRPSNGAGYTVTETQPAGISEFPLATGTMVGTINAAPVGAAALNVISAVTLGSGNTAINYDFREQASSIAGFVYRDDNDDGAKGGSESGLAGVTITLKNAAATVTLATTTTDATGAFRFTGLPAATYVLEETPPTGYLDGKETDGSLGSGTVDNSAYDNTTTHNRIGNIVLPVTTNATSYLFGERGGSLNGFVYVDSNNNGLKDGGEAPIQNVQVTLSGTVSGGADICTILASCVATTDATGAFLFEGVPPGTYTLVESQVGIPANPAYPLNSYSDGKETAGVAGGTVDNSGLGTNPGYNTISNIVVTAANITANAGNIGGYLFGERPASAPVIGLVPPIVSGYVYRDHNHDRARDTPVTDDNAAGWTVSLTALRSDGSSETICQVLTDDVGFYHLDNLNCLANFPQWSGGLPTTGSAVPGSGGAITYTTFSIGFAKPGGNGIITAPQSGGNAGTVDVSAGQITNVVLHSGDNITEQNLPLDPAGVVYDAVTRQPVANAQVQIFSGGALLPGACLTSGQNTITTGANGFYQFLLVLGNPGCPLVASAVPYAFTLGVTPPAGYAPGISTMIPPTAGPQVRFDGTPSTLGGVDPIQLQGTAPAGVANTAATRYFLNLSLTLSGLPATSSSDVVNNHIPIDPISNSLIVMSKTTPLLNVVRGDLVPYTVTAINTVAAPLANINVTDLMPPGFKYRKGSATLNGVALEPTVTGRQLVWPNQTFAANQTKVWKMLLLVGTGVGEGEYTNQVYSLNNLTNGLDSNVASATVRVVPDPTFDCSDIIGKVFDDINTNGYQDDGEPGIPNVRIATPRGLLVTTDAEGRFHVACADIPQADHGSNFVMKLDERTLPSGYRVTTENPRDVRTTRGKMVKLNFGAALHRVVRLDLNDGAFETGSTSLKPEWQQQFEALPDRLKEKPSILRLAYKVGTEDKGLAEGRLKAISARMQALWKEKACCHLLQIEEELVTGAQEGK